MNPFFQVEQGRILMYHLFDIADEIDLGQLQTRWSGKKTQIKLISRRASPDYMQFSIAPLLLPLGSRELQIASGVKLHAEVQAKVFWFGVISICWEVSCPTQWLDLVNEGEIYIDNKGVEDQSHEILQELLPALENASTGIYSQILEEDYTIYYIVRFDDDKIPTADQLIGDIGKDIARIVRGETKRLSEREQEVTLQQRLSYFEDDLVVVTWNAAFIYDPEDSSEHVDMLEFAHAELLELRSYDAYLDRELEAVYDEVEQSSKKIRLMLMNPYRSTIQKLLTLVLDVTELTDRIENSLKIIGELYSARIYRIISQQLYLKDWQARVDGKLANARMIYETLNDELESERVYILELMIVVMIAFEIGLILFPVVPH